MPTARPIIVIMFETKNDSSNTWPTSAVSASATMIETPASISGSRADTSAPNTISRMIERHRDADRLAGLQVGLRDLLEVTVDRRRAGEPGGGAVRLGRGLGRGDDGSILSPAFTVAPEDDLHQLAVGGDGAHLGRADGRFLLDGRDDGGLGGR